MYVCSGENKNGQLETLSVYRRTPAVRGVRSLPPQIKNPRYGPGRSVSLNNFHKYEEFLSQTHLNFPSPFLRLAGFNFYW